MAKKAKKKRRTSKSSGSDVKSEMRRYKKGTAKSGRGGKGGKVKSKKQAIAIGLSKARKKARRSPRKRSNGAICRHSAVTRHSGRLDVPCHAWRQVSRHMAQNFRVVRRPSTVAL